jgi:hypothetical protein
VTGKIVFTFDQLNYRMENVIFDSYSLIDAFHFDVRWNYPEAYRYGAMYVKNLTGITSKDRTTTDSPRFIMSKTPGPVWFEDFVVEDYYNIIYDPIGMIGNNVFPDCVADVEDYNKTTDFHNFNISMRNPNRDSLRYHIVSAGTDVSGGMIMTMNFTGLHFHDIYQGGLFGLYFVWKGMDSVYYTDSTHSNYTYGMFFGTAVLWKKVVLQNLVFENTNEMIYQSFFTRFTTSVEIRNIIVRNYTGAVSAVGAIIAMGDYPTTSVIFENFHVENSNFYGTPLLKNILPFESITLSNVYFSNVTVSSGNSIIVFDDIHHFNFVNHTYNKVTNSDTTNEGSAVIQIVKVDLTGDYETEVVQVSKSCLNYF